MCESYMKQEKQRENRKEDEGTDKEVSLLICIK